MSELTPFDRVMLALDAAGFGRPRPKCPTCPPSKRRGFSIAEAKTEDGEPTVLIKCHRGCDTMAEILPALGLDPADLYANANGQGRLFDAGRYSPVDRLGWLAMPPSLARHLGVATTYGRFLSRNGHFGRVWASGDLVAVIHEPKHQRQARAAAGLSADAWKKVVQRLAALGMAHRCGRSETTYFRHPMDACPRCGEILERGSICPPNGTICPPSRVASFREGKGGQSVPFAGSYELGREQVEAPTEDLAVEGSLNPPPKAKDLETYDPLRGHDGISAVALLEQDNERRARQREKLHKQFLERKARGELSDAFLAIFPEHRNHHELVGEAS